MSPTTGLQSTESSGVLKLKNPTQLLKGCFQSFCSEVRWEHLVAGVTGGVVSTVALHPLDLIKVRLQVNDGRRLGTAVRPLYSGMIDATSSIFRGAGVRGLYQGVVPNLVGAGSSWGLYFLAYNTLKARKQAKDGRVTLDAHEHMWIATQAGVYTLVLTNPIWVTKTRLCLQYDQTLPSVKQFARSDNTRYRGMFDCLRKTFRAEGVPGLYKGFIPGVVGTSHGALQFMAYEELKKLHNHHYQHSPNSKLGTLEYLTFAAISKIFAASATYPYQVVRSRLQDQHRKYDGVMHVIRETYRYEGWRGFFKGIVPGVLKVTPACCVTFVVYEHLVEYLKPTGA